MNKIRHLSLGFLFVCCICCVCNAENCLIDSCYLGCNFPDQEEGFCIRISGNHGLIYCDPRYKNNTYTKDSLSAETCKKILKDLQLIFIEKKSPVVVSKTKANEFVYKKYPFLFIEIHLENSIFEKLLIVNPRTESRIYHYSEAFIELWNLIQNSINDYQTKYLGKELIFYNLSQ